MQNDSSAIYRIHIRNSVRLPEHLILNSRSLKPGNKCRAETVPRTPIGLISVVPHQQLILVAIAETGRVEPEVDTYVAVAYTQIAVSSGSLHWRGGE